MTIEELYAWAKNNNCEKLPIVITVDTSKYENRVLSPNDIFISKDLFGEGLNKKFFGSDNIIRLG